MNPETQVSVAFLISVSSFIFAAINFYTSRKKNIQDESKDMIKINLKLDTICATTNETKNDIKNINDQIKQLTEQQIVQSYQIKEIWKHINKLEEEK